MFLQILLDYQYPEILTWHMKNHTNTYPRKSTKQGLKHLHCPCLCVQTGIYASANALVSRYKEFLWSLVCRRWGCSADSRTSETESPLPDRWFFFLSIPLLAEIRVLPGWRCWGAVLHPAKGGPTSLLLAWAEWWQGLVSTPEQDNHKATGFLAWVLQQYCEVCVGILGKNIICMLLRKSKIVSLF